MVDPCHICGRSFGRAEHRARHMLTHTLTRPFQCIFCHQRFQRSDALKRHTDKYCDRARATDLADESRSRAKIACVACRAGKIKCDSKRPCQQCSKKKVTCIYPRERRHHIASQIPPGMNPSVLDTSANHASDVPNIHPQTSETMDSSPMPTEQETTPPVPQPFPEDYETFQNADPALAESNPASFDLFAALDQELDIDFVRDQFWPQDTTLPALWDDGFLFDNSSNLTSDPSPHTVVVKYFNELMSAPNDLLSDDSLVRWLNLPLIPRAYDLEVLNALINIFMRHASGVFSSFEGFCIHHSMLPEQLLAMAAVGALFCDVPGSSHIGRVLYTDSFRMVAAHTYSPYTESQLTSTSLIQTYILLELYGLFSSLQRARELTEGYHYTLFQKLQEHNALYLSNSLSLDNEQNRRLLSDVLLLECYRFSLLQLQPILTPPNLPIAKLDPLTREQQSADLLGQYASVLCNDTVREGGLISDYDSLSSISFSASLAMGNWIKSSYDAANREWRADIADRLLLQKQKMLEAKDRYSALLLCHMIGIALHAPLAEISLAAYHKTMRSPIRAPTEQILRNWLKSDDWHNALQHALDIQIAGKQLHIPPELEDPCQAFQYREAPHDAFCVYLAGLVIWVSGARALARFCGGQTSILNDIVFILRHSKVEVARNLYHILAFLSQNSYESSSHGWLGPGP